MHNDASERVSMIIDSSKKESTLDGIEKGSYLVVFIRNGKECEASSCRKVYHRDGQ